MAKRKTTKWKNLFCNLFKNKLKMLSFSKKIEAQKISIHDYFVNENTNFERVINEDCMEFFIGNCKKQNTLLGTRQRTLTYDLNKDQLPENKLMDTDFQPLIGSFRSIQQGDYFLLCLCDL